MPIYLNNDVFTVPLETDVVDAVAQIIEATKDVPITPAVAITLLRKWIMPLLPGEHQEAFAGISPVRWDTIHWIYVKIAFAGRGTNKRLLAIAAAVELVHKYSCQPPREIAFPTFIEVGAFFQMAAHARLDVARSIPRDRWGNSPVYFFCKYCWRPARTAHGICSLHSPTKPGTNPTERRTAAAIYKEATRLKPRFDQIVASLVSAEVMRFHESEFTDPVFFPQQGISAWLLDRRPLLSKQLPNLNEDTTDEQALLQLGAWLYGLDKTSTAPKTLSQAVARQLFADRILLTPVVVRAEGWLKASAEVHAARGGSRPGAGRPARRTSSIRPP